MSEPVDLRAIIPPDHPKEWVEGFVVGYMEGYRRGIEWARAEFVRIMKEHYERVAGRPSATTAVIEYGQYNTPPDRKG